MDFFLDEDIRHYIRLFLLGFIGFIIGATALYFVFRPSHKIVLKTDTIEYGEKLDGPAKLVDKVGKVSVSSSQIKSPTTIKLEQYEISFSKIDTSVLGKQEIKARFSDSEIRPQTLIVNVVDSIPPEITLNDMPEEVELAYIESEDFLNSINVFDNFTPAEDINLDYSFSQKPAHGAETELMIRATDSNGNTSDLSHVFKIKDLEIDVDEVEKIDNIDKQNDVSNDNAELSNGSNVVVIQPTPVPEAQAPIVAQPPVSAPQPQPQRPSNKFYMFSDGYDMQTAPSACQSDLMSSGFSGACLPIQDDDGIYKGMQLIFD